MRDRDGTKRSEIAVKISNALIGFFLAAAVNQVYNSGIFFCSSIANASLISLLISDTLPFGRPAGFPETPGGYVPFTTLGGAPFLGLLGILLYLF